MGKKRKSPSQQRAALKWLRKQRDFNASIRDELRRQQEHEEWQMRTMKNSQRKNSDSAIKFIEDE